MLTCLLAAALLASRGGALDPGAAVVALEPAIADTAIVGRASCGASTWLLNRSAELIELPRRSRRPVVRGIRGLRPDDPFWGLACLADGSLWTLETRHVLARLTPDGGIVERHTTVFPQLQLFGAGDRLLFFGLPIVANKPLLAAGLRREPQTVQPWNGLVGRSGLGPGPDIATNLVACGISFGAALPCWFADDDRVSVSDGTTARTVSLPSLRQPGIAEAAPIRDAALVEGGALWVLAASPTTANGRRVGTRIIQINAAAVERFSAALPTAARLIVTADANKCVLLTVTGNLMYVSTNGGPS